MVEATATRHPRIALVHGDTADVAPLRAVLEGAVDVVYSRPAAAFDVDRVRELEVASVLVSLDGGDWLEALAGRAEAAGIPLVFDDPLISGTLEGWARARWLRHLAAKLAGSRDYDPPRPVADAQAAVATATFGMVAVGAEPATGAIARPLSAEEITALAARFDRVPGPDHGSGADATVGATAFAPAARAAGGEDGAGVAGAPGADAHDVAPERAGDGAPLPAIALALHKEGDMVEPWKEPVGFAQDGKSPGAPAEASAMGPEDRAARAAGGAPVEPAPVAGEPVDAIELDPDTAALSALIDSQLAAPAGGTVQGPGGVWRIPERGTASPAAPDDRSEAIAAESTTAAGDADAHRRAHPVSDPVAEAEVLKGLPSVDDWQLVDAGIPDSPAPEAPGVDAGAPTAIDIAGLELVPMEDAAVSDRHSDPIERWMDTAERVTVELQAERKRRSDKDRSRA